MPWSRKMKKITITDEETVVTHTLVPESDEGGESVAESSKSNENEIEDIFNDNNLEEEVEETMNLLEDLSIPFEDALFDLFDSKDERNQFLSDSVVTGDEVPQHTHGDNMKHSPESEVKDSQSGDEGLLPSPANRKADDHTPLSENTKVVSEVLALQTNDSEEAELDSNCKVDSLISYQQNSTFKGNESSETNEKVPTCVSNAMGHDCFVTIGQTLFEESNARVTFKDNLDDNRLSRKVPSIRWIFYAFILFMVCYYSSKFELLSIRGMITPETQTDLIPDGLFPNSFSCNSLDYYFLRDMHDCRGFDAPSLILSGSKPDVEGAGKGIPKAAFIVVLIILVIVQRDHEVRDSTEGSTTLNVTTSPIKNGAEKKSLNYTSPSPTKRAGREVASLQKESIILARYSVEVPYKGGFKEVSRCVRILPQSPDSGQRNRETR